MVWVTITPEETQEELREKNLAALLLVTMKHLIVDEQTSITLEALKTETLCQHWMKGCESFKTAIKNGLDPALPELGNPIDGLTPPKLPPVKGRLSISKELFKKFVKPLMSDEERRSLKHGQETQVDVYGSKEIRYSMKFKIWSSKMHVLTSGWNEFRGDNAFKALYDWVTLWVFRHKETEKLCFVMIARTFPTGKLVAKRSRKKMKVEELNWQQVQGAAQLGHRVEFSPQRNRCDDSENVSDQPIGKAPQKKRKAEEMNK
ncbi:hypothetical protein Acr_00g0073120 [Actinidia rufa]|uniref:B3 domain-containing protein n=1 Tax=Actinidia rufa TaxID=165716 RepID=A0A7J0DTC4_9ERIC|nr:hypothetical protein Acr_00g0073120 [Actinidia rufa]